MKRTVLVITLFGILLSTLVLHDPLFAATYYVLPNGSETSCTIESPCTLNTGLGKLTAGDTLYLRGGTYRQTVSFSRSGTSGSRITISGYPGETAIIDGEWTRPSHWGNLFLVTGEYVTVQDLTIKRSNSIGLQADRGANHVIFRHITSEYNYENGIIISSSDYGLIDGCTSYYDCYERVLGDLHGDRNWVSCVSLMRGADHCTIQNTTVSYCSGESLSMYTYSEGGNTYNTLQDNTVYHSGPPAIYIQNCRNCTVQRNLLYNNTPMAGSNVGIYVQDEYSRYMNSNHTIVNNFVKGFHRNFYWGHAQSGDGVINTVIAGNTFVNATSTANMKIDSGNHSGSVIKNNIFIQEDSVPVMLIDSGAGLGFGYNNYNVSSSRVDNDAKGTGDRYSSDPLFAKTGSTADGQLSADWFKLTAGSPCIDAGTTVAPLTEDYWGRPRPQGSRLDIGGHEYTEGGNQPPDPPTGLTIRSN